MEIEAIMFGKALRFLLDDLEKSLLVHYQMSSGLADMVGNIIQDIRELFSFENAEIKKNLLRRYFLILSIGCMASSFVYLLLNQNTNKDILAIGIVSFFSYIIISADIYFFFFALSGSASIFMLHRYFDLRIIWPIYLPAFLLALYLISYFYNRRKTGNGPGAE